MFQKKTILTFLTILSILFVVNFPLVLAAPPVSGSGGITNEQELFDQLKQAGEQTSLSDKDPRLVVTDIIKTLLSILGIVFLVLVVYAGFLWMTAAGEEKNVEKAKDIIKMAVIGLMVVLLSYSITLFVAYWLQVAVSP